MAPRLPASLGCFGHPRGAPGRGLAPSSESGRPAGCGVCRSGGPMAVPNLGGIPRARSSAMEGVDGEHGAQ